MSQLRDAMKIVRKLDADLDGAHTRLDLNCLRDIVLAAQNGPPYGQADGSISEETWRELQLLIINAEMLNQALDRAMAIAQNFKE